MSNDQKRLEQRLEWEGYTEIKMKSDGNCQFRALSHQLYKTADFYERVRKEIVQQLKSRPKFYQGLVEKEFSRYVKNMSNDSEWGDEVTLTAAANLYGVKIIVLTSMKNTPVIVILPKSEKEPDRVIYLSYLDNRHYNSIHLKQGSDTASMELKKKKKNKNKNKEIEEKEMDEKEKEEKKDEKKKEKEEKEEKKKKKKEKPTVKNYKKKLNRNLLSDDMSMPSEGEEEEQEEEEKIPRRFHFSDFM